VLRIFYPVSEENATQERKDFGTFTNCTYFRKIRPYCQKNLIRKPEKGRIAYLMKTLGLHQKKV
jgi:hypothetical protein